MKEKPNYKYQLSSLSVANYFLEKADKESIKMTNIKLNKLVYIAHGWCLAMLDKSFMKNNEEVLTSRYGAVISVIYLVCRRFGCSNISHPIFNPDATIDKIAETEQDILKVLELVWKFYKNKSSKNLIDLTQQQYTPWDTSCSSRVYKVIDNNLIKDYYKNFIEILIKNNKKRY